MWIPMADTTDCLQCCLFRLSLTSHQWPGTPWIPFLLRVIAPEWVTHVVINWCWNMGKCLSYFGDVQVFHICSHCDSGPNFSAHQHVWQYRDPALAWRRLKPSVLLRDRKDAAGLGRTGLTQGSLSEKHDLRGNFALSAYAETYKSA